MSSSKQGNTKKQVRKINERIAQDQKLLEDVVNSIPYDSIKHVLVKPLDPIQVQREIVKPTGEFEDVVDDNGVKSAVEKFDTVVETVDSGWRTGIVLQIPKYLSEGETKPAFKIGDIVVFPARTASYFDLFKDSMFINSYDVVAIKKPEKPKL